MTKTSVCERCSQPIPASRATRSTTCSDKCANALRQARKRSKTGDGKAQRVPSRDWQVPRPLEPGDLRRVIRAAVAANVTAKTVQRALPYFTVAEAQEMLDSVDDDAFWASPC